jgi:succinate dehydrogenase / fumarate reductase, cytochrome b subunit
MPKRKRVFTSTVGKKILSAVTGLLLCLFLVGHLGGNLLIFWSRETFNAYSHHLITFPLLIPIELSLLALFLFHAYMGARVYMENKKARPVEYYSKQWTRSERSRKSVGSTTMMITGLVVIAFLIFHIWHFKYGKYYEVEMSTGNVPAGQKVAVDAHPEIRQPNGGTESNDGAVAGANRSDAVDTGQDEMRDLAKSVTTEFKKPLIVAIYVIGMILIGFHLYHGFASAFQSMGVSGLGRTILYSGWVFAAVIVGGFILIPLWIFVFWR